jgi:molybdate transport system ATP-binding protein
VIGDTPRLVVDAEKHLAGFDLRVRLAAGTETLVLFGPSGAGKTTTLNVVAGLVNPDGGEILLDGEVLFRKDRPGSPASVPARRRRIGYVFQSYALFPHLTALENVAFPLWRRPESGRRAADLLERVHLEHLAGRYPHELSGGQQQRVALARALAAEPRLLLLDEPFAALDAAVREQLQRDLRALQAELGLVMLYVTHRLEDAFAMGHRLAVVQDGRVAQAGLLEDVLRQPASHAVAQVMGIRNLLRVRVTAADAHGLQLDWEGLHLEAPPQQVEIGTEATAYIRPEEVKIIYPDRPITGAVGQNLVEGTIVESLPGASLRALRVLLENGLDIEVRFPFNAYTPLRLERGARVRLALRRDALVLLTERYHL